MVFTVRLILGVTLLLAACTSVHASQRRSFRRSVSEGLETAHNETLPAPSKRANVTNLKPPKDEPKQITKPTDASTNQETVKGGVRKTEINNADNYGANGTSSSKRTKNRGNMRYFTTTTEKIESTIASAGENVKTERRINNGAKAAAGSVKETSKNSEKVAQESNRNVKVETAEALKESVESAENIQTTKRTDNARSLSMNIEKYISPEFHGQNEFYTSAFSPETKKLINFFDYKTSSYRLTEQTTPFDFSKDLTTPKNEFFDSRYSDVKDKILQSLESIDHAFEPRNSVREAGNSEDEASKNVKYSIEFPKNNDTKTDMDYKRFMHIEASESKNKNKVHKDYMAERGMHLGMVSSFNDTKIIDEGLNKIPATGSGARYEPSSPEKLPDLDHQESKKVSEVERVKSDFAEYPYQPVLKKLTVAPAKPSPNKPETKTDISSPLSNKIETDFTKTTRSSASTNIDPITSESDYEKESRENAISVFKRGSTKSSDAASTATVDAGGGASFNQETTRSPEIGRSTATTLHRSKEYENTTKGNATNPNKIGSTKLLNDTTEISPLDPKTTVSSNLDVVVKDYEKTSKENIINVFEKTKISEASRVFVQPNFTETDGSKTLASDPITSTDVAITVLQTTSPETSARPPETHWKITDDLLGVVEEEYTKTLKGNAITLSKRGSTKMAEISSPSAKGGDDELVQPVTTASDKVNSPRVTKEQPNDILSKSFASLQKDAYPTSTDDTTTTVQGTTEEVATSTTEADDQETTVFPEAYSTTAVDVSWSTQNVNLETSKESMPSTEETLTTELWETTSVSAETASTDEVERPSLKSSFFYNTEQFTTDDNIKYYAATSDNVSTVTEFAMYEVTTIQPVENGSSRNDHSLPETFGPNKTNDIFNQVELTQTTDHLPNLEGTMNASSTENVNYMREENKSNLTENDIIKQNEVRSEKEKTSAPQNSSWVPETVGGETHKDAGASIHEIDDDLSPDDTDDEYGEMSSRKHGQNNSDTADFDEHENAMVDKHLNKNFPLDTLNATTLISTGNIVSIAGSAELNVTVDGNRITTVVVEDMQDETTTMSDNLGLTGPSDEDNSGKIAAIVISSVGAVCLLLLAGLLVVMRKRQKRFNYGQRCRPVSLDAYSMDNVSICNTVARRKGVLRTSKRSYGNPAFDDPVSVTHPLNFSGLTKFADNQEDIKAEFEEIPQVTTRTNELPEGCEIKNRYANVIPLPETRVFLNFVDGYSTSDYVNANYVRGAKGARHYYIACQAPMQNTIDDFWRMVWEQQSKVVLMLTNLFENGVEKCADYLPPSEVVDCHRLFGDYQVTLKKREVKDKYVISNLQLKNMVSNSWRDITHLWYLEWPEKGVPEEANSLIAFLIEARSYMKSTSAPDTKVKDAATNINGNIAGDSIASSELSPVIVHCSPGTGRTGTVIACDIAIREFELSRQVDIPKIVYRIRRDRASSVQTKDQYAFIYKLINLYATKLTGGALDSI